jgi:hypothetical protein
VKRFYEIIGILTISIATMLALVLLQLITGEAALGWTGKINFRPRPLSDRQRRLRVGKATLS